MNERASERESERQDVDMRAVRCAGLICKSTETESNQDGFFFSPEGNGRNYHTFNYAMCCPKSVCRTAELQSFSILGGGD